MTTKLAPNPYAAPQSIQTTRDAAPHEHLDAWRSGPRVVCETHATLPARCVLCNAAADTELTKRLSWHHPLIYLTIFAGILIYVLIAVVTSKRARVTYSLCGTHASRRRAGLWIGYGGFLGGICIFPLGYNMLPTMEGPVTLFGIAVMLGSILAGAIMTRTIRPARIDREHAYLHTSKAFRRSLPSQHEY